MGIRAVANYTGKRSCHRMPGGGFDSAAELITSFNGPKVWYDFSNVSTLQQDSAGTIPVAAAGDPIGRVMDISGANNHAIQVTDASRPLWQTTFAALDGTDDSWITAPINFTSTNKVTVIAGVRKLSDLADGVVCGLGAGTSANGSFEMTAPGSATVAKFQFHSRGTVIAAPYTPSIIYNAPISAVLSGVGDISAPLALLRVNGLQVDSRITSQGTGNFSTAPIGVGRRSNTSLPFNGNLYGLIVIGRLLSTAEIRMLEQYMAQKAGISF